MPNPIVNFRLDPKVIEQITAEAERRGITRTDLFREGIARVLELPAEALA
jgi:antitoxin component of RelBE/YafQ-DinJ toxin-antitoxin module